MERKTLAGRLQQLDLEGIGRPGTPHPRAGGEDLKGVGAQIGSLESGLFERPGGERMEA
jgi:hypothetical protein